MTDQRAARPVAPLLAAGLAALGIACTSPTESCAPPLRAVGAWSYAAAQEAPVPTTYTGTLVVERQACRDFEGTLDVLFVDASGGARRLTGQVTGRVIDAGSLQFDALLGPASRQHLAEVRGDSLTGSWLELGDRAAGASGVFRGTRREEP